MKSLAVIVDALRDAGQLLADPDANPRITAVVDDSRAVTPGALFCAVEGIHDDGHRYAAAAIERGAAALLVTRPLELAAPQVIVRDGRRSASVAARTWYDNPARVMNVIAVTGTNGKSTTAALIRHLMNDRQDVASIGTLGVTDGRGNAVTGDSQLTTPGPVQLHALLARLERGGHKTIVLEASSHGLSQGRLDGIGLQAAVFTNLTHDHLDYHANFEEYRNAKFQLSSHVRAGGIEVVNADDAVWRALPQRDDVRRIRYGRARDADIRGIREELSAEASQCVVQIGEAAYPVRLPLVGEFNVSNALAAAATAWGLGIRPDVIVDRLASAPQVPGRVEQLVTGAFSIVRDYAHTPDALHRIIAVMRSITPGRLIVLFGAGGDRDRGKRPAMGRIAADGADVVYLTSDNPRTEDPERILDDIEAGMAGCTPIRIEDRREAIRHAVDTLKGGDCLVLAGKGHEDYQIVGHERKGMDEAAIVEEAMKERAR